MVNAAVQARHFEEDIVLAASTTYSTASNTATVARAVLIERMVDCRFKGMGTTYQVIAPVAGSESGQTFKYKVYTQTAATAALAELANGATISTSAATISAEYEGT